ncbi:MAG: outer membrane protein assembly factor BamD, partial [Pseudomonadota bacterium]
MTRKSALIAAILASSLTLSGCALLGGSGGSPRDTRYVARDVNTLYSAAKARMDNGDYRVAAALF